MGRGGAGVKGGMSSLDWVGAGPGVQRADSSRLRRWNVVEPVCSDSRSVALNNCSVQKASRCTID